MKKREKRGTHFVNCYYLPLCLSKEFWNKPINDHSFRSFCRPTTTL